MTPARQLVMLLLIACLFTGVLWVTARVTQASSLQELLSRGNRDLQLYMANIRQELDRYEYLPKLLADDSRLQALLNNPWKFDLRASVNRYLAFVAESSGASDVYLMDRTGLTLASSNWDKPDSFIGDNYSFRPYFKEAVKGGLGHYYALGWASGQRGYYFAYPVRVKNRILGVITVKVPLSSLESERGGKHYEFVVTGPDGVIFLATRPQWRYHTLTPLTQEARRRIMATRQYGERLLEPLPVVRREPFGSGASLMTVRLANDRVRRYLVRGVKMPQAGWRVYILSNTAPVSADVTHAMLLAGFVLGALVLASLILYQRRARLAERVRYEHQAMEAAAANETRVRAVIDSTRAGLVTLDDQGRIESFNPTAAALFRRSARAVSGRHLSDLLVPIAAAAFRDQWRRASEGGDALPAVELAGLREGGVSFPLEVSINSMRLPEGKRFIVTLHDISERIEHEAALKRAHDELEVRVADRTSDLLDTNRRLTREIEQHRLTEAELRQTRGELIQAAKLAAIGQLAAGINHELNQPLTAIRFYAANARTFLEKSRLAEAQENLLQISGLTERMARIITQLKLFARKSSGKPVPVSLTAAIDGALALLAPRLQRRGVKVVKRLPPADILCLGDMVRLEQVFVNLIGNGIQAMENQTAGRIEVDVTIEGRQVSTAIRDSGPGIPVEDLPQIFDPFFTTKEAGEGLGLGLSISRRIIEELGGTMRASNHSDGGAVFTVELPAAPVREVAND